MRLATIAITIDRYSYMLKETSVAAMARLGPRITVTAKRGGNVIPMPRRTGTEG